MTTVDMELGLERDDAAIRLRELETQCESLRGALRAYIEDADRLRGARDKYQEMAERAAEPAPLTMETLGEAFDSGKASRTCEAGDIVITREREGWYTIVERRAGGDLSIGHQRILPSAPAPEREPWQDLADILLEDRLAFEEDVEGIVKRLHERGVRVVGGDES